MTQLTLWTDKELWLWGRRSRERAAATKARESGVFDGQTWMTRCLEALER